MKSSFQKKEPENLSWKLLPPLQCKALFEFAWRLMTGFATRRMYLGSRVSCHKAANSVTPCRARSRAWFPGLCDVGEPSTSKWDSRPWCSRLQSFSHNCFGGGSNSISEKLQYKYWRVLTHQEDGSSWFHHNQKDAHQTSPGSYVPYQKQ